jgi:hypothetical protein
MFYSLESGGRTERLGESRANFDAFYLSSFIERSLGKSHDFSQALFAVV